MHSFLLNLYLFAFALGKCGVVTGILPAFLVLGLYNFQRGFVPKILSGEKTHTIRAIRAHPDRPGNTLHLFTGLRQKGAMLLMRVPCVKVEEVTIRPKTRDQWDIVNLVESVTVTIEGIELSLSECEAFARRDGFENFDEMLEFWAGRLPFRGHIIHWRKAA